MKAFAVPGLLVLLLAGCVAAPAVDEKVFLRLHQGSPPERDAAFQELLRAGPEALPLLRAAMGLGPRHGFPVVALLYAQGRGDGVPLDLRAIHLAAFEWPAAFHAENALVEIYVREEIEQDLARIGRPSLSLLGRALEFDASSEAAAVRVIRAMLRIGGRAAAEEFARLLAVPRRFGALQVDQAAAAALLHLGFQDLKLRLADPEARVAAARSWWEIAKDYPESEWLKEAMDELGARASPKDPEGVGSVMALFSGRKIEDPKAWWEENRGWTPKPPLLDASELLRQLAGGDPALAWDLNRRLELATGTRVFVPSFATIGELCAALRLWRAPGDLERRWRRQLETPLLRFSIAALGTNGLRWAYESYLRPPESESGELRIETGEESYTLFVHARDLGSRLLLSESFRSAAGGRVNFRDFRDGRPAIYVSVPFRSVILAVVEEVDGRRTPPPAAVAAAEWRARLRRWEDSPAALRALGYYQEEEDRALFLRHQAAEALLMLGDPAGLALKPQPEDHEIEMALRKATDPVLRAALEALRSASPR